MRVLLSLGLSAWILAGAGLAAADDAADIEKGKKTYTTFCATCHGPEGDGKGVVGAALDPKPRNFRVGDFKFGGTDQDIFDVISNGAASKGGSPLMAPWSSIISDADRWALVKYVRSFKK